MEMKARTMWKGTNNETKSNKNGKMLTEKPQASHQRPPRASEVDHKQTKPRGVQP
jgi:hypothetical protein